MPPSLVTQVGSQTTQAMNLRSVVGHLAVAAWICMLVMLAVQMDIGMPADAQTQAAIGGLALIASVLAGAARRYWRANPAAQSDSEQTPKQGHQSAEAHRSGLGAATSPLRSPRGMPATPTAGMQSPQRKLDCIFRQSQDDSTALRSPAPSVLSSTMMQSVPDDEDSLPDFNETTIMPDDEDKLGDAWDDRPLYIRIGSLKIAITKPAAADTGGPMNGRKFGKGDAVKRVVNRVPVDGKFEVIGFGKSGEYELKWVMRLLSCFACSAAPLPPASRCSSALRPKPRASCASSLTKSLGVPAQSCFGRSVICAGGDLARRPGI